MFAFFFQPSKSTLPISDFRSKMFSHVLPANHQRQQTPPSSASSSSSSSSVGGQSFVNGGDGGGDISARFFRPQSGFDSTTFSPLDSASHSHVDAGATSASVKSDGTSKETPSPISFLSQKISTLAINDSGEGKGKSTTESRLTEGGGGIDQVLPPSRLDVMNPCRDSSMSFRYLHPASTLDSTTDSVAHDLDDGREVCLFSRWSLKEAVCLSVRLNLLL